MDNRQLIIRVSRNSLSFSASDHGTVRYEQYPLNSGISIAANLREALRTIALLEETYSQVLAMIDSPVLMIPVNEFREEDQDTLYRHAFGPQEQQVVMHTVLPDLHAVALYSVHKDLRTVIGDAFPAVRYSAAVVPVWRHLHQRSFTGTRQKLYAYFHDRRMEVFSFVLNRFKFCNSFVVNNPNDALYYMLAVWKQLALSPEHDELYMVGDVVEREQLVEEAQKFLKRIYCIHPSGEFNRAAVTQIQGMPYDLITYYVKGR